MTNKTQTGRGCGARRAALCALLLALCVLPLAPRAFAASGCNYPTTLDGFSDVSSAWQLTPSTENPGSSQVSYNRIQCAVEKLQAELGALAKGSYGSVKLRLDDAAYLSATQTLLNKTLTSPTIQGTVNSGSGLIFGNFSAGTITASLSGTASNASAVTLYSTGPGLINTGSGLSLLRTCADGELLKWDVGTTSWICATDLGAASVWSSIVDPVANQALSLSGFTTMWTWGAATGAGNLFSLTDTASNTGTGILAKFSTASGSGVKPFRADANGNGVQMSTAGALAKIGTGSIIADSIAAGALDSNSGLQVTSGLSLLRSCADGELLKWVSGAWTCAADISGGTPSWDSLSGPLANQAFSMAAFTSTWTWGAATGAGNLFSLTDTASNTGTGVLAKFSTASGSGVKPFQADANGNGVQMSTAGVLAKIGTGSIAADTAIALASNPTDCPANKFAQSADTSANLGCDNVKLATADVTGQLTVNKGGSGADLSATGGANQFVKQSTTGGAFSVGAIAYADISSALSSTAYYADKMGPNSVDCTGATDSAAKLNAAVASVPDYSRFVFPIGCKVAITAALDVSGRKGLYLQGVVSGTESTDGSGEPEVKYIGSAGGTMVLCSPCQSIVFDGIMLYANDLADFGFQALYNASPTYNVQFTNVGIDRGASGARTNFIAIDWCGTGTTSNCEQLVVERSHLVGSGISSSSAGVRIGHSNSVQNKIDGNTISYFGQGVRVKGQTQVSRNVFDHNGVDISCQVSEPVDIAFNRTENGKQFFNGNCSASMHDNRLGSHDGTPASAWIDNGGSSSASVLAFVNNVFTGADTLAPFAVSSASLYSVNNYYPTAAVSSGKVTSMDGFGSGYTTLGDQYPAGLVNNVLPYGTSGQVADGGAPQSGLVGFKGVATLTAAGSTHGSGLLGQLNGSGSGAAVKGTTAGLGTSGAITEGVMVEADLASIANGTAAYSFLARGPTSVNSFTTLYGLYIGKHKVTGVTTGYGVYQADAADINYFGGATNLAGGISGVSGSTPLSTTKTVRASGGAADCTLIFTSGVLTGGTC